MSNSAPDTNSINRARLQGFADWDTDAYAFLQMHRECNEKFRPLEDIIRAGKTLSIDDFDVVYVGALFARSKSMTAIQVLEDLYRQFNCDHPSDFRGHSMSQSDVILLKRDGVIKSYYCDYIGFTEITGFYPEQTKPVVRPASYPERTFIAILGYDEGDKFREEGPGDYLEKTFSDLQAKGEPFSLCDWALTDSDCIWEQYIMYLTQWAIDNSDPECQGMSPVRYDEWLANREEEE